MSDALTEWLSTVDLLQTVIFLAAVTYVANMVFRKFLPTMGMMNKIVESVKDLPADIPKLKKELEETKKKVANIEKRLDRMVSDNLLPREGELDGDISRS